MTAPLLTITAYGLPAPQGSKRHVGRGVMVESSKYVKPWREDVRSAATAVVACGCPDDCGTLRPGYPLDGPLVVRMVFTFARPRSHYRTGRNAHLLRDNAAVRPQGAPDLSKLLRSTEDALTSAGAWRDDARVVEYQRAAKVWVGEDPEALDAPGVVIHIWPLDQLAAADASLPSGTDDILAWMRRHGLGHGAGVGAVLAAVRAEQARPVVAPYGTHAHGHTDDVHQPAEVTA